MSQQAFNESLYREHFEELASLSEIRAAWLSDGESTLDVAGLDERMDAHLDALVLGGALALDVVQLEARPDEPGTFYAWVALACRVGRLDMIRDALVALEWFCDVAVDDAEPSALRRTVADALSHMGDDRRNAIAAELPQLQEARIQLAGPPSARHDRRDPHHSVGASNDG